MQNLTLELRRAPACRPFMPVKRAWALGLALWPLAAAAQAFEIAFPVDCTLGDSCFVQNYLDHDPGPGMLDFQCSGLGYDGHDGTDIAVPTVQDLAAGLQIRAVAPGQVLGLRNDVADNAATVQTPQFPAGQDCGNGLVIDHGAGWHSQYCHMAPGSIGLQVGDKVQTGTSLGLMGLSGNTAFPHLHLTIRKDGRPVDPFAPFGGVNCMWPSTAATDSLWAMPMAYQPGGIIGLGMASQSLDFTDVKAGLPPQDQFAADAPALVVWAHLFGTRSGDMVRLRISGPDGVLVEDSQLIERGQARAFRMLGRKLAPGSLWPAGDWQASASQLRDGKTISQREMRFTIAP